MLDLSPTELCDTGELAQLLRSVAHHVTKKRLHVLFIGDGCRQRVRVPPVCLIQCMKQDIVHLVSLLFELFYMYS